MNITIVGRKCNPHEDFRARAEKRLSKVEKLFGEEANAKVTATVEKNCQIVEVTVTKGGMIFRSEERADNMADALDECVDSLIRQIRKNKTRLDKRLHSAALDDFTADAEEEKDFDVIVNNYNVSLGKDYYLPIEIIETDYREYKSIKIYCIIKSGRENGFMTPQQP